MIPLVRARNPRLPRRLAGAFLIASAIVAGAPAVASACTMLSQPTTQAFSRFGDQSNYWLIPGGSFEIGTTGWSLNGASVTVGNEPFYVRSTADRHALTIPQGASAISAPFCVDTTTPTFRLFAHQGDFAAILQVMLLWPSPIGQVSEPVGLIGGTGGWSPSQTFALSDALPLFPGQTQSVQLEFTTIGVGSFTIDDIYADPYSRGQ